MAGTRIARHAGPARDPEGRPRQKTKRGPRHAAPRTPQGTDFQEAVWRRLCAIRCGDTTSYGRIAREVGSPQASRAVGAAVGRNPITVIVPCHRVIGENGTLTGYAGGLHRKQALLDIEGIVLAPGSRHAAQATLL